MDFNEGSSAQHTVKDFFAVIFKHYKKVMLLSLTIIIAVAIGTLMAPDIYQAEAKLFVKLGNQTLNQGSGGGERIQISQTMENQLNSELQILQSIEIAGNVVNAMGRETFLESGNKGDPGGNYFNAVLSFPKTMFEKISNGSDPGNESLAEKKETAETVQKILDQLETELAQDSNIINIRYLDTDPGRAYEVLQKLVEIYMTRHMELNNSPGSFDFFRNQSEMLRERLEAAESKFKEAKNEIGVSSLEENRAILSKQIGNLKQKLEETESGLASSRARIGALEARISKLPENSVVSETTGSDMSAVEGRLYDLKMKEQELLSTFKPESVPVSEIRRQIHEAETLKEKTQSSSQVTTGVNPLHQQLNLSLMQEYGTLDALRAQQSAVARQFDSANARLRNLNTAEVRLAKMNREKTLLEENYKKYAGNLEQVRIDKAKEIERISNISIAQAPVVPVEPIRPQKTLNLILGAFLSLFGGLGLAFFLEYIDDRFRKPEDIESILELPVLGSIRKLSSNSA